MKAIRRSLKGDRDPKPHISVTPKSAIAILPPKKVIKALYDYQPEPGNDQELAFSKGDFFHVISREDDPDWYEACNPLIPNARGLVPVSFFEVVSKNDRHSGSSDKSSLRDHQSHDSGFSDRSLSDPPTSSKSGSASTSRMSTSKGGAMVYGVVLYDFHAERPDELEATAGEAIIVIAQSNPEWFVAKPIGRLGGPGLIPVSFIEIRDMMTGQAVPDPLEAVRRAGVPRVEEWKKMTAEYKNSSIALGKLDSATPSTHTVTNSMEKLSLSSNRGSQQQNGHEYGYHSRTASKASGGRHPSYSATPQQHHRPSVSQGQAPRGHNLPAPVWAAVPRYCFDNDKYWYIVEVLLEDGTAWELSRYYHDFYDLQIALLAKFEEEAGAHGHPRTLPYMPGPVTNVTEAISNGRRQSLDEYVKKLIQLPPHISRSELVCRLFQPRQGDFEIDPNALEDAYRLSGESQHSAADYNESRQSSQSQMSASISAGTYLSTSAGQASSTGSNYARGPHQRQQSSLSQQPPPPLSQQSSFASHQSRTDTQQPPPMNRQTSSLTQASTTSNNTALKVKVFFQDDLIALRVSNDVTFQQLVEKLHQRLKVEDDLIIQYRDEPSGDFVDMQSDNDLNIALQRNHKLTLRVTVA